MSPKKRASATRTPLEWTVLGASIVATGALVLALITSSMNVPAGPPDLSVTVGKSESSSGGVAYELIARNRGGETAEDVQIEVTIGTDVRTLTLAAVSRSDQEKGVVVFPAGTSGEPIVEVLSYSVGGR